MKKNRLTINKYFLVNLLLIVIVYVIMSIMNNNLVLDNNLETKLLACSWITNFCFMWCIYSIYKIKKNIFDFNILFLLFLFLFSNGQVFLFSIGISNSELSVFLLSNIKSILNAETYFCYSLLFFNLGSLLIMTNKKNELKEASEKEQFIFTRAIRTVAVILVFVTFFFYVPNTLTKFLNSVRYGYEYLYETETTADGMALYLAKMFIPSIILLLYSYNDKKILRRIIIIILAVIALMNLIIGARGTAISIIVILLVYYNIYIQNIKGKKLFTAFILVLLIMITIPTIYTFRSKADKNIDSLFETIDEVVTDKDSNFVTKTVSELGYTMHSFILTYDVIPEISNYKYGESYIASVLMLIPSKILGGYSFAEKAALDSWLQKTYNMSYGPGFSIVAETYYNFGWYFGIIFSFCLGAFYTFMFNLKSKDINKDKLLKILSLIFLFNSLLAARYPFHNTTRNVIYMYFVIYMLILITFGYLKRKDFE